MRLAQNIMGISKLALILLMFISFLLGATLSYIWTMGFYAPGEFNLPSQPNLAIENVQFDVENAAFFNVTVLNPSYSSDAKIEQIKVSTEDGTVHSVTSTSPPLPFTLPPGESRIITSFWNWGNYAGQTVEVYVLVAEGSGSAAQAKTTFMNLTVTDVIFEPSVTATRFNITVESMGSSISVDINKIAVDGAEVMNVTPTLPFQLNPDASATFTLHHDWTDLQNKTFSIAVETEQGYIAYKNVLGPLVKLDVFDILFFNTTATSFYFNITVQNLELSAAKIDISLITVYVEEQNITITLKEEDVAPTLPQTLEPNSTVIFTCSWDWSAYEGTTATVTAHTIQGFKSSTETTVQNLS